MPPDLHTLQVQLLCPEARPPTRAHRDDAGIDLSCLDAFELDVAERKTIRTGLAVALPAGIAGLVVPRSGLAAKHGISVVNGPGLIDPGYRGEIKVVLINLGDRAYEGIAGQRIAQLLLVPFLTPEVRIVDQLMPTSDERGANGFGSTDQ